MTNFQRLFFLLIILTTSIAALAQEQPQRTWIGVGFTATGSTADRSQRAIIGLRVDAAYDLRHGFQARGHGVYRDDPVIKRLLTGYLRGVEATSELVYGADLVYHVRRIGNLNLLLAGGVITQRQFFEWNANSRPGDYVYNSTVNPSITAGAGIGKNSEFTFTKYFQDTYGNTGLRGWGVEITHIKKLDGRLHLRFGASFRDWRYELGSHTAKARELSGFVQVHFQ